MRGAKEHDAQVHAEVKHLEELGLGESQHDDSSQLGQCDAAQHLYTHTNTPVIQLENFQTTMEPVYNDHPMDCPEVVVINRWSLYKGQSYRYKSCWDPCGWLQWEWGGYPEVVSSMNAGLLHKHASTSTTPIGTGHDPLGSQCSFIPAQTTSNGFDKTRQPEDKNT